MASKLDFLVASVGELKHISSVCDEWIILLVSDSFLGRRSDMQAILGVGFQSSQFGLGLSGVGYWRFFLDLGAEMGALDFLVEDSVAGEDSVGFFRLLPDQVERRRTQRNSLKLIDGSRC